VTFLQALGVVVGTTVWFGVASGMFTWADHVATVHGFGWSLLPGCTGILMFLIPVAWLLSVATQ
jgi:hypothetical protein